MNSLLNVDVNSSLKDSVGRILFAGISSLQGRGGTINLQQKPNHCFRFRNASVFLIRTWIKTTDTKNIVRKTIIGNFWGLKSCFDEAAFFIPQNNVLAQADAEPYPAQLLILLADQFIQQHPIMMRYVLLSLRHLILLIERTSKSRSQKFRQKKRRQGYDQWQYAFCILARREKSDRKADPGSFTTAALFERIALDEGSKNGEPIVSDLDPAFILTVGKRSGVAEWLEHFLR